MDHEIQMQFLASSKHLESSLSLVLSSLTELSGCLEHEDVVNIRRDLLAIANDFSSNE
jgi:hypothetical protein